MISRRMLLGAVAFGGMAGIFSLPFARSNASIRLIGQRRTIIALLDTGETRVLIALGELDEQLLANVAGIKTIGNTRVDLVIATHRVLAKRVSREHLDLDSIQAISVQGPESLPPIRGKILQATQMVNLEAGGDTLIHVTPAGMNTSATEPDHPDFLVSVECRDTRIVLASSDSALRLDGGACSLLVTPGSPGSYADGPVSPQLIVTNSPNDELSVDQIEVFPTDPIVARIETGKILINLDQLSS